MNIAKDILYVGVNDHEIDLFEGQYDVPDGMAYNSYLIVDEKTAVMDSVEARFGKLWLENIEKASGGKKPDYLIVQHMEPDHSGSITAFMNAYPEAVIVSSDKAFPMMKAFLGREFAERRLIVGEGDTLSLGSRELSFISAPMIHWPEVIMTYDSKDKVFFSADAFGKFGALDSADDDWACEARRYYIGIVGKYGRQVQTLLKKAAALDIEVICPLHGPVLSENLDYYFKLYDIWSSYAVEEEGVVIAYASIYGNTKKAAYRLAELLEQNGCTRVVLNDLARCDMYEAVEDAFRYSKLVLAASTYNGNVFPVMREFIHHLTERNYTNRRVALIENGSWAPAAAGVMKELLGKSKGLSFASNTVTVKSALNEESEARLAALAEELCSGEVEAEAVAGPEAGGAKRKFLCKVCGYIYEGEELPPDYTCPLCRRGADAFEEIKD